MEIKGLHVSETLLRKNYLTIISDSVWIVIFVFYYTCSIMDPIEAQHIRTHLTELVQKTKCNVTLIAYIREKGLISEEDKQDLVSTVYSLCFIFNFY